MFIAKYVYDHQMLNKMNVKSMIALFDWVNHRFLMGSVGQSPVFDGVRGSIPGF